MRQGFYRTLLFLSLILFPAWTLLDVLYRPHTLCDKILSDPSWVVPLVGFLLLPVSAIGLWDDRKWGMLILIVATALCAFRLIGMAIWAAMILVVTVIRRLELRRTGRRASRPQGDLG